MAAKMISTEAAARRFMSKVIDENYGHEIEVIWSDDSVKGNDSNNRPRREFNIMCKKCNKAPIYQWGNHQNADGSIPARQVAEVNAHILRFKPKVQINTEPYIVMSVKMRRGDDTEFWVAPSGDKDWHEAIGSRRANMVWAETYPWMTWKKDSRGKWHYMGAFHTEMQAVAEATQYQQRYTIKGYGVAMHHRNDDVGAIPPAATVKLSVRALIDEYKKLRKAATPIEVKEWMEKVDDALTQVNLLETLRDEVNERFMKSMEI